MEEASVCMRPRMKWVDITRTLGVDTVAYPDDDPPVLERVLRLDRGDPFNLTRLAMTTHTGTHLDAPRHFFQAGAALDELPPDRFILEAVVVSSPAARAVTAAELAPHRFAAGQAVLFKTRNGTLDRSAFHADYVHLSPGAARYLADQGVALVGIDYLSVDPYGAGPGAGEESGHGDFPAHRILLGAGCLILEDVDLRAVPPGRYLLVCLPLRLHRAEGAPCRALLGAL